MKINYLCKKEKKIETILSTINPIMLLVCLKSMKKCKQTSDKNNDKKMFTNTKSIPELVSVLF